MKEKLKFFESILSVIRSMKTVAPYLFVSKEPFRSVTEEYPDRVSARMPEDLPVRYRGFLFNDIDQCSGCRYCYDVCPVECIRIETEPGPQRNLSWVSVFDIDQLKCIFCGYCVEICPTGSLKHTKEYQGSVFRSEEMVASFGRGWASKETKEQWISKQIDSETKAEEMALYEKSPLGASLRKKNKEDKK